MKSHRHDFSLEISMYSTVERFEDHSADFVIQALEERLKKLKADKKNWRGYVRHHTSEENPA